MSSTDRQLRPELPDGILGIVSTHDFVGQRSCGF